MLMEAINKWRKPGVFRAPNDLKLHRIKSSVKVVLILTYSLYVYNSPQIIHIIMFCKDCVSKAVVRWNVLRVCQMKKK